MTLKRPIVISFFIAIVIMMIFLFTPISWLQGLIDDQIIENSAHERNAAVMYQGEVIQSRMFEDKHYLPLFGSSELSSESQFHPSNYFKVNDKGLTPFLIGRGGTQSLINVLMISPNFDKLAGRKMVFILSPQWFEENGLIQDYFSTNYSKLQAYNLAFNNDLDKTLKKKVIKRLLTFNDVKEDTLLKTVYEGETSNSFMDKMKGLFYKPAAYINKNILEKKDFIQTMLLKEPSYKTTDAAAIKDKNFEYLIQYATEVGQGQVTTNPYSIQDSYFNDYIKGNFAKYKNRYQNRSYSASPEYDDLGMLLDLLKEAKAEPLFISVPVNGNWYDYAGFPEERREAYYQKVKELIASYGFSVADYSNHEYEKYFLKDVTHVGWKGWVYINRDLDAFYRQGDNR